MLSLILGLHRKQKNGIFEILEEEESRLNLDSKKILIRVDGLIGMSKRARLGNFHQIRAVRVTTGAEKKSDLIFLIHYGKLQIIVCVHVVLVFFYERGDFRKSELISR